MLSEIFAGSWCIAERLSALALCVRPVPETRQRAGSGCERGAQTPGGFEAVDGIVRDCIAGDGGAGRLRQGAALPQRLLCQCIDGIERSQQAEIAAFHYCDPAFAGRRLQLNYRHADIIGGRLESGSDTQSHG